MVGKPFRLAVLFSAIATSPTLAQQSASQLVNVRHVGTLKLVWPIDRLRTPRGVNSEKISSNLPPVRQNR